MNRSVRILGLLLSAVLMASVISAFPATAESSGDPIEGTIPVIIGTTSTEDPFPDLDAVYMIGDTDLDGRISINDATVIQKALAEILTLSILARTAAETDGDGVFTINDATVIQKTLAGEELGLPIGESRNFWDDIDE